MQDSVDYIHMEAGNAVEKHSVEALESQTLPEPKSVATKLDLTDGDYQKLALSIPSSTSETSGRQKSSCHGKSVSTTASTIAIRNKRQATSTERAHWVSTGRRDYPAQGLNYTSWCAGPRLVIKILGALASFILMLHPLILCIIDAIFLWPFVAARGEKVGECDLEPRLNLFFFFSTINFSLECIGSLILVQCHRRIVPYHRRTGITYFSVIAVTMYSVWLFFGVNATVCVPKEATCPERESFQAARLYFIVNVFAKAALLLVSVLLALAGYQFEDVV